MPDARAIPAVPALPATPATPDRFPALDGLRGVAILLVIAQHGGLLPIGWVGVDLFFALSGFLITGILLDAQRAATTRAGYFGPFFARRALRILPIALLVLAGAFVVVPIVRPAWRVPAHVQAWYWLYVANWRPGGHSDGVLLYLRHFWSLAVEEQFYLVWPGVVLACGPRRLRRLCVILVAATLVARCAVLLSPWRWSLNLTALTVTRWGGLLAGAYVAALARQGGLERWRPWLVRVIGVCGLVVVTGLLVQRSPEDAGFGMASVGLTALGIGMGAVVAWTVLHEPTWLCWRPLRWVGGVSYGLYVYHHPIAIVLTQHLPSWNAGARTLALLALSLPVAAVSWYMIERPVLSLKRYVPMPRPSTTARDPVRAAV